MVVWEATTGRNACVDLRVVGWLSGGDERKKTLLWSAAGYRVLLTLAPHVKPEPES